MTDVFISYSRKDKAFVQRLFVALESQRLDAWVDWDDIEYAEDWWQKIQRGISGADHFVFIMSPHSVRSKVCFDEVQCAVDNGKRIIPVIMADVADPVDQERIHPALKSHNWLFFRPEDDFDTTLAALLETLRREPEHVHLHTRLLVNAREWLASGRNKSLLLRGDNLRQAQTWLQNAEGKSPVVIPLHREYIAASQQAERAGRRRTLTMSGAVVLVVAVLALIAFALFRQNQRATETQNSLNLIESARAAYADGHIFEALGLAVQANTITDPPAESLNTLREIAGSPGPIALFSSDTGVTDVAFSPDQQRIIAGYADGSLRLWDATDGVGSYESPLFTSSPDQRHTGGVNALDLDLSGHYVASGGCAARDPANTCIQPEVFLWEINGDTLVLRHRYVPPGDGSYEDRITSSEVYDLKFNPQIHCGGDLELGLAFGLAEGPVEFCYTLDDSGAVSDLLVQDWISGHLRGTTALDYGPDGDEIVAGGLGGGLRYWQGANNDPAILTGFDARVTAIAISADPAQFRGSRPVLSASADGTLRKELASTGSDPNASSFSFDSPVTGLDFSADGAYALAAIARIEGDDSSNGRLLWLDMAQVSILATRYAQSLSAITAVDYGGPTRADLAHPYYTVSGSADGTLILWDMAQSDLSGLSDAPALLAWLHANRYVPDLAAG